MFDLPGQVVELGLWLSAVRRTGRHSKKSHKSWIAAKIKDATTMHASATHRLLGGSSSCTAAIRHGNTPQNLNAVLNAIKKWQGVQSEKSMDSIARTRPTKTLSSLFSIGKLLYIYTRFRDTLYFVEQNRNITLSLPRELLRQIKRLAADRDTSVSAMMIEALTRLADEDRRYSVARRRALASLLSARSLGTGGHGIWSRDELHER